jgi:hypothetical protein
MNRDRRQQERRGPPRLREPIERRRQRREEDRREGPRVSRRVTLIELGGPPIPSPHRADLSMEGVHWHAARPPGSVTLEVRFTLPDVPEEVRLRAVVVETRRCSRGVAVFAQFLDVPLPLRLALARYLERSAAIGSATSAQWSKYLPSVPGPARS